MGEREKGNEGGVCVCVCMAFWDGMLHSNAMSWSDKFRCHWRDAALQSIYICVWGRQSVYMEKLFDLFDGCDWIAFHLLYICEDMESWAEWSYIQFVWLHEHEQCKVTHKYICFIQKIHQNVANTTHHQVDQEAVEKTFIYEIYSQWIANTKWCWFIWSQDWNRWLFIIFYLNTAPRFASYNWFS